MTDNVSAEAVLLDAMRRGADQQLTNYDDDEVYLRTVEPSGLTDCCLVEKPCDRHVRVPVRDGWGPCRHGNGFPCPICVGVAPGRWGGRTLDELFAASAEPEGGEDRG